MAQPQTTKSTVSKLMSKAPVKASAKKSAPVKASGKKAPAKKAVAKKGY